MPANGIVLSHDFCPLGLILFREREVAACRRMGGHLGMLGSGDIRARKHYHLFLPFSPLRSSRQLSTSR